MVQRRSGSPDPAPHLEAAPSPDGLSLNERRRCLLLLATPERPGRDANRRLGDAVRLAWAVAAELWRREVAANARLAVARARLAEALAELERNRDWLHGPLAELGGGEAMCHHRRAMAGACSVWGAVFGLGHANSVQLAATSANEAGLVHDGHRGVASWVPFCLVWATPSPRSSLKPAETERGGFRRTGGCIRCSQRPTRTSRPLPVRHALAPMMPYCRWFANRMFALSDLIEMLLRLSVDATKQRQHG
ncbi:uncharacterized protein [Lolium perenne]|uniref:uncharacterized protein n=1 Tax=Lolium perenne TaxID=4522 RepID=UPI003A996BFD